MALRDQPLTHRQRAKRSALDLCPQVAQEPGNTDRLLHRVDGRPVHAGSVAAAVPRDPAERHEQRRRVVHKVEQVVEPAARIGHRPTVKLGLHSRYPSPGITPEGRATRIHEWIFRHHSVLVFSFPLPPFPMCRAFPGSEYYGGSAPLRPDRSTVNPTPAPCRPHGKGVRTGTVPTFTDTRSTGEEPRFVPAASSWLRRGPSP